MMLTPNLLNLTRLSLCASACAVLVACAAVPEQSTAGQKSAAEIADIMLPKPDANGSYLFWTPEEQLVGYRNIEKIYKTRVIEAGGSPRQLPVSPQRLSVSYEYKGETWNIDTFMKRNNVAGMMVMHKGMVTLEEYRLGYGPGQRWTSFSVGKSISSTLAGVAIKDGYIDSVDDPVTKYLPGLKGSGYDGVSLRQIFNMTSGVKWSEDYADPKSDVGRIRSAVADSDPDAMVSYMSKLPREAEPGTKFSYKTGETHLIGSIVRAATGKHLADYLSEKIWKPYGMEADAYWMLDSVGNEYAGCCISATLRDFARFGLFFLNGAKVGEARVVEDSWIQQATAPSSADKGYGYQWWLTDGPAYYASGIFGQNIWIDPSRDLIIVTQSAYPTATDAASEAAFNGFVEAVTAKYPQ